MTQILPVDDTFDENATNYGTYLTQYIGWNPWVTAGDTVTGYTIANAKGYLHDGYSGRASFSTTFTPATTATLCSVLFRPYYATRVKASLSFSMNVVAGTPTTDSFRYAAVFARASGGTEVTTTNLEVFRDGTCYAFVLTNTSALGAKYHLLRVNAGAVTTVATAVVASFPNGIVADIQTPIIMALNVDDSSGNPVLVARVTIAGAVTTIFNATDSSGSKITTAGRCGFGMCRDRQVSGTNTATISQFFAITDLATNTVVLLDEWDRGSGINAALGAGDANGTAGKNLQCAFGGGLNSIVALTVRRDAGNNRILTNTSGPGASISTRPANSTVDHHRSAVFNVTNPSSVVNLLWGIQLRGTATATGNFASGYFLRLNHTGSQFNAALYVVSSISSLTLLASATAVSGITLGVNHTLEFQVYNVSDTPTIKAFIGASSIPWVPAIGSVTVDGSNVVRYTASGAPLTGDAEGLYLNGSATGPGTVRADTWTQLAPAETEVNPDNQAGIALTSEVAAATGTFPTLYDWNCEEVGTVEADRMTYDSDHTSKVQRSSGERRRWRISANLTATEVVELRDFWDDHDGGEIPFTFNEPAGSSVTAKFLDDTLVDEQLAPEVFKYEVELEEMIAP